MSNKENITKILGDDMLSMGEQERLIETIKDTNNDKKVLKKWMALEKAKMVYENDIEYAREQGIEEGIKQGIKEGIEEGTTSAKLEMIKNMIKEGTCYEFISKITGKTNDEIIEIKNNM